MIRMSKETDYGILLLTYFARGAGESLLSARELAGETGVPLPMVSKILKTMARAGLLMSQRGAKGGYSLARRASDISLVDVLTATEGSLALTECIEQPGDCRQESTCRVRRNWELINERVLDALSEISIVEMSGPVLDHLISLESSGARNT